MEQAALRPKPIPGQESGGTGTDPARRPRAARRRGRRLTTLLAGMLVATALVLSGIGLGTVAATVIGMSKLAEVRSRPGPSAPEPGRPTAPPGPGAPGPSAPGPVPEADMVMGVEVTDAEKSGALVVGVHVPGPGYTAGLVRGDVLLTFDGKPVESAADLVRAVDEARPGAAVLVTVRHESGGYQQLSVAPGVLT
ncbi:PDZ domain-containing protein [Streptomyces sp. NPDC002309]